jgi:hypothetical protein
MAVATLPEELVSERSQTRSRTRVPAYFLIFGAAFLVFVTLAVAAAWTKAPWCDEGWFACPAYNLAFRGHMGTNVLEPSGHFLTAYLRGVQQHTYLNPPGHFVLLAGWFRTFGFSLFTMRTYSILWGSAYIALLFFFVRRFGGDVVASLAIALTSIDFVFVWGAADGRMEAATGTLMLAAVAAYAILRERNLKVAIGVSQALCAAAWLMHPIAFVSTLTIAALVYVYDRQRLRWSHLFIAALPYVIAFSLWGIYIAQSPSDFLTQFRANAAGRGGRRATRLFQPWLSIADLVVLYIGTYEFGSMWTVRMNPWMFVVPFLYLAALVYACRSRCSETRLLRICAISYVATITFLAGFKAETYLVLLAPMHNLTLALLLQAVWRRGADGKVAAVVVAFAFIIVQLSTVVQHLRMDERRTTYRAAMEDLELQRAAGKTIMASSAAGFALGFDGFVDDGRLGCYSKRSADVLLVERSYRMFVRLFDREEPTVYAHAVKTLTHDYKPARHYGDFWIFERVSTATKYDAPAQLPNSVALLDGLLPGWRGDRDDQH